MWFIIAMDKEITQEMKDAGNLIASELVSASMSKSMGGIGGCLSWSDFLTVHKDNPNLDLIKSCVKEEIDSVTAIYIAMERKK